MNPKYDFFLILLVLNLKKLNKATSFLTSGPPYPDLFLEDGTCGRSYNGNETELKYNLLSKTWDDVHIFKFPARYAQGRFRTLQPKYLVSYPLLRYSLASDGVYCAQCHLFAGPDNRVKTLVRTVLRDWSNISKIVVSHSKSASHLSNCEAADNFLAIMKGDKKDICCNMSSQYNAVVENNRNILVSIVEAIIFLGKQNIAIRGHEEEKGNFRALLNFQAKHDTILKEHLEKGDARSMYLIPDIQNELISICGNQITEHIVSECNRAPCFGFVADEATDARTMEQMALCLRYYDGAELREDFILFAECKSTTGESLAEAFLTNLDELTLASTIVFNRMRAGEVSKMQVLDYTKNRIAPIEPAVQRCLSTFEQSLCKTICRTEIAGKRGRTVPLLFPPNAKRNFDILIEKRPSVVGMPNTYMFPVISSLGHIRGTDSLRKFSKLCGAKKPELLRSIKLRKQIATLSQIMNLKENKLDIVAQFLGHDIRVHREYYRLPDATLQVAKVSKLLLMLEKGDIDQGKTLDEINIEDAIEIVKDA